MHASKHLFGPLLRTQKGRPHSASHVQVGMKACNSASLQRAICLVKFSVSMEFGKWICYQYVLSFALQKVPIPTLCFQYVLSFVFNVAFCLLKDIKSSCDLGPWRLGEQHLKMPSRRAIRPVLLPCTARKPARRNQVQLFYIYMLAYLHRAVKRK